MTQETLLPQILRLLPSGATVAVEPDNSALRVPGAYVLLLHLAVPLAFSRRGMASAPLSGWYLYVGSAHGGGGIGARLRHHFRTDKRIHWHIDELTLAANRMTALAIPDGAECDIVARLGQSKAFVPALKGFGSSDCTRCTAHLLQPASQFQT
mgnify:CR=1 FL=1